MASQLCSTEQGGCVAALPHPLPSHTLSTLLLVKKTLQHDRCLIHCNMMIVVVYYSLICNPCQRGQTLVLAITMVIELALSPHPQLEHASLASENWLFNSSARCQEWILSQQQHSYTSLQFIKKSSNEHLDEFQSVPLVLHARNCQRVTEINSPFQLTFHPLNFLKTET